MMDTYGSGSRDEAKMSEAAIEALAALLEERRAQALVLAQRSSPNEVITAADIIRAFYASAERRPGPVPPRFYAPRRTLSWALSILGAVAGLLGAVLAIYGLPMERLGGDPNLSSSLDLTAIVLSALAVAVLLSVQFIRHLNTRRAHLSLLERFESERRLNTAEEALLRDSPALTLSVSDVEDELSFLYGWSKVEERLRRMAYSLDKEAGREPSDRRPIGEVMAVLSGAGVMDSRFSSDLRQAIAVRNMVAHGESVPPAQTREGVTLLHTLEHRLEEMQHRTKPA